MTYTYDDIVTAKDILTGKVKKEDIIGKRGWFLDVIPYDMSLDKIKNLGVSGHLEDLHLIANGSPFGNGYQPFAYFLPEKEQSYEERQAEWVKENDIKLGDKVRILRKFNDFENGCDVGMNKDGKMDSLVGTVGKVSAIDDESIEVDSEGDCWFWPYFVLEKVENEPEAEDEPEDAKPQFKVGDKVRIVKEWDGFGEGYNPTIGETGRIDSVMDVKDGTIKVVLDSDNDWWWYRPDAVELIKDESAYIPFDLSDPKDRDSLRGKWVRSKNPDVFNEFEIAHFVRINNTNQDIKVETSNGISYFARELLYDYEFLDGSVIGKPANGQQMKQLAILQGVSSKILVDSEQESK